MDAFALLLSSSKKHALASRKTSAKRARSSSSSSPSAPSSASRGSRFVECPLCGKSVHSSLAQAHVERCASATKGEVSPPSPTTTTAATCSYPSRSLDAGTGAASVACARQQEAGGARPGERSAGTPPPPPPPPPPLPPPPVQATAAAKATTAAAAAASSAVRSRARNNNAPPAAAPSNAFSTLMAASALSNFREEMYLWAHEDGTFSWGWGPVGNPLPHPPSTTTSAGATPGGGGQNGAPRRHCSWSCQVATKGPDGRKAGTCDLWTNLPPAVPAGGGGNVGLAAARPGQSLSRLPVAVVKSMLQKNVRRGRAEAAVRCALELALRSWSDAIRRVLVIIVEDSLLHPAAPLLTWLMVATSKGYRPPCCLLEAFLCVVHETTACPVRDSTDSCRHRPHVRSHEYHDHQQQQRPQQAPVATKSFDAEDFPVPHPKSLLVSSDRSDIAGGDTGGNANPADAAVANIRRALLMRVSYGGMPGDQALLKGACLAWGERCGHYHDCSSCGAACTSSTPLPVRTLNGDDTPGSGEDVTSSTTVPHLTQPQQQPQPPDPPTWPEDPSRSPGHSDCRFERSTAGAGAPPFTYTHESVLSALRGNGWTAFLTAAHGATGMPPALRSQLMAHVAREAGGGAGNGDGGEGAAIYEIKGDATRAQSTATNASMPGLGPILREADAILSGVDFHCSGVLDELLRSTAMSARVGEAIRRRANKPSTCRAGSGAVVSGDVGQVGSGEAAGGAVGEGEGADENEVVGVRQAAKQAMWAYSGGLNFRRLGVAFSSTRREERCHGGSQRRSKDRTSDCCGGCWSSPGLLEELPGVRVGECAGDIVVWGDGTGGASSPDMKTRVWSAISPDVLGWTRRFVKARLARG